MGYITRTVGILCALSLLGTGLAGHAEMETSPVAEPLQSQAASDEAQARESMARTQQMLIDLGYLFGAADGICGPMTASALKRFQADQGLAQTGAADDATVQALTRLAEETGDARALQQRLIDLGYLRGAADGVFGQRSRAALSQFQAVHGLPRTGMPDDATRAALFSQDARALPARIAAGSKGDEVTALQQTLIRLGFLEGEADGSYGVKTVAAVKRFQKHLEAQGRAEALGIEPDGEATGVTLMVLYDPDYSSFLSELRPGDAGDEVRRVERRLAALGYMDAAPDDALDDYAASAAAAFREAAGLSGDAMDRAFIDALFAGDAPAAAHFVLHTIALGDAGEAVREVQQALVYGGLTVSVPDGVYGKGLVKGVEQLHDYLASMGSPRAFLYEDPEALTVEAQQQLLDGLLNDLPGVFTASDTVMTQRVQRRLHTLYYLSAGGIDGGFGEKTRDALRAFQAQNGLPETGIADTATLGLLFSPAAAFKPYPYRVEVSIERQRVFVYELQESGEYELVQTFVCSTGMGNSTPRGVFLDGGPANVWHHFSKFDVWARYSFEIEGDIMFHSVLFDDKDPDTLREGSLYALGQKASHGCIRLSVKNARWLFEHCRRGSLVIVIY